MGSITPWQSAQGCHRGACSSYELVAMLCCSTQGRAQPQDQVVLSDTTHLWQAVLVSNRLRLMHAAVLLCSAWRRPYRRISVWGRMLHCIVP